METQLAERHDKVIDLAQDQFVKRAQPGMNFDVEKGYAIQLLERNKYLMDAAMQNQGSLLQAMTNVASIGLSLNPAKKQGYLIPRNVKFGNQWVTKVFFEPSFMGLCDLATQSGVMEFVQAKAVHANDTFEYKGVDAEPLHNFNPFKPAERGDFVGVYCIAKTTNGAYLTEMMDVEDVNSIRDRSEAWKNGKNGPWSSDYEEMAKKSVVRRAFKMWPKSKEMEALEHAVDLSNQNEGFEPILTNPVSGGYTSEQKEFFDQCLKDSNGVELYLLCKSIDENQYIDLYHSFEAGKKGANQKLVDNLMEEGRVKLNECVEAIDIAAENNDDLGVMEYFEEASDAVNSYYLDNCNEETVAIVKEHTKG